MKRRHKSVRDLVRGERFFRDRFLAQVDALQNLLTEMGCEFRQVSISWEDSARFRRWDMQNLGSLTRALEKVRPTLPRIYDSTPASDLDISKDQQR